MSAELARPAPAIVRSTSLDFGNRRSFLADIVIDYGPEDVLARLFLKADTELREKGVRLSFASLEELVAVNQANSASWRPILPIFDPAVSDIEDSDAYALLGRNASGEVVTAQANRYYRLGGGRTLKDEIESLRLFYRDPEASKAPGEALRASAPIAANMSGPVLFTGAAWYRRDYRKLDLMNATSPITRGIGYTRWSPDFCFSFMAPDLVRAGVARNARMPHVEWEVTMVNTPVLRPGTINAALIWTNGAEHLEFFDDYLAQPVYAGELYGVQGGRRQAAE